MKIIITAYENNELTLEETYTEREDGRFDYISSNPKTLPRIVKKAYLNNEIFMTTIELTQGKARGIEIA